MSEPPHLFVRTHSATSFPHGKEEAALFMHHAQKKEKVQFNLRALQMDHEDLLMADQNQYK